MISESEVVEPASRMAWRAWLTKHHAARDAIGVVIYKTGPRRSQLTLHEAQEEALCFGWVDVKNRRVDAERYMLYFAPRKPGSAWSLSNIERAERLEEMGLMTEAGRKSVSEAKANGQWELGHRIERTDEIPPELRAALIRRRGALAGYKGLTHSRKKQILRRYLSAIAEKTRQRIIDAVVREVQNGF